MGINIPQTHSFALWLLMMNNVSTYKTKHAIIIWHTRSRQVVAMGIRCQAVLLSWWNQVIPRDSTTLRRVCSPVRLVYCDARASVNMWTTDHNLISAGYMNSAQRQQRQQLRLDHVHTSVEGSARVRENIQYVRLDKYIGSIGPHGESRRGCCANNSRTYAHLNPPNKHTSRTKREPEWENGIQLAIVYDNGQC